MPDPMPQAESFRPEKSTIGSLLATGNPPLEVPDYQRDYSWQKRHAESFLADILDFDGLHPADNIIGREYFLGATVLANKGASLLILDGQQRLATSTILVTAIVEELELHGAADEAKALRSTYVVAYDPLSGPNPEFRLQLNVDDQPFFRDFVQEPKNPKPDPKRESHERIAENYRFFTSQLKGLTQGLGASAATTKLLRLGTVLMKHTCVLQAISASEDNASRIFITLNDRGIGLSLIDHVRSIVLQSTPQTARAEVVKCWSSILEVSEKSFPREDAIRLSWIADNGDVKERRLHEAIRDYVKAKQNRALDVSKRFLHDVQIIDDVMDADAEDDVLRHLWLSVRGFKANPVIPVILASSQKYNLDDQKAIISAAVALFVRYYVVGKRDRSALETVLFLTAVQITKGEKLSPAINRLKALSPDDAAFEQAFSTLSFSAAQIHLARTLLERIEETLREDDEQDIAGSSRVHVEHIMSQKIKTPPNYHTSHLARLGNLTLLGKKLNQKASNKSFSKKSSDYYKDSTFKMTTDLCTFSNWNDARIDTRQAMLHGAASKIWPASLVLSKS